jgi:hypothetical protein
VSGIERAATISACGRYRYSLWRRWAPGDPYALFVLLNPSTADASIDDPTVRRCVAYARAWGYPRVCVANLFAFRATRPDQMMLAEDPIGPDNDRTLAELSRGAADVIAGWGVLGAFRGRGADVRARLLPAPLHVLKLTHHGHPGHPLYLPSSARPVVWQRTDQRPASFGVLR